MSSKKKEAQTQRRAEASIDTPSELSPAAITAICDTLRQLLADVFVLYVKTKSFHWHMSGPHFRDYHVLLDEQAAEIFAMTDPIAERARKIGGTALWSVGDITKHQRLLDNNDTSLSPKNMLEELGSDSHLLTEFMRAAHGICEEFNDVATTSLLEVWIDEGERRMWFLRETVNTQN